MRLFTAFAVSLFLCLNSYGATVESVKIIGSPTITETDVRTISSIPDSVIDLFHAKGGHILYVSAPLEHRYEDFGYTVYGLYHIPTHRIYIRNGAEVGGIVAHELGHFLWHETRPSWSADARATFTDPEEFAQIYCNYCRFGGTNAAINSIHMTVEKLLERGSYAER